MTVKKCLVGINYSGRVCTVTTDDITRMVDHTLTLIVITVTV